MQAHMKRAVTCVLLLATTASAARTLAAGDGGSPTVPPPQKEQQFEIKRLPIEFLVEDGAPPLLDVDTHWFCVKLRLLPEDGGDMYAVYAQRVGSHSGSHRYAMALTPDQSKGESQRIDGTRHFMLGLDEAEEAAQSPYQGEHAKHFVETLHPEEDEHCKRLGGVYTKYSELQAYVKERMTQQGPVRDTSSVEDRDVLETHIKKWNKFHANVGPANGCSTQTECEGYHVSYAKIPEALQENFTKRLLQNWELFYERSGAGIAGTTGANFIAGNRGYRFPDYGQTLMNTLFTEEDTLAFEEALSSATLARKDIREKFGTGVHVDFQHRLWRYGPDFPVKGALWHRDTCPFGIGGGVPEDAWQLTSVYVFYAQNLDLATSGTRLKDRFGETHEMPCVPGTANIMRSGENDPDSPWHAGPVLRKVDDSQPAYRVMLQSKMVLKRALHEVPAGAEVWGALGFSALPVVAQCEERAALGHFFAELSQALAWGASESNAVGSEAYPINARRAWDRTEELASFFGFQGGFLPTFAKPPVDVEEANEKVWPTVDEDPHSRDAA